MQRIGRWILEYDSESYLVKDLYLYWVVSDNDAHDNFMSFCIGYNTFNNNLGFLIYDSNNKWNKDIEIIERIKNDDFPWIDILLLSHINNEDDYEPQYYEYIKFIEEVDINEVKRLIDKELVDDLL